MRPTPFLLLAPVLALACADVPTESSVVPPPSFITSGRPDGEDHPYVGFLAFEAEPGNVGWVCSGSLLSPTVVLTAGHCTEGAVAARIWMASSLVGNAEFPDGGVTSYEGTPYLNPDYCVLCGIPSIVRLIHRDVGIVVLSEPVPASVVDEYVQLPAAGLAGMLANKAVVDLVGYGNRFRIVGGLPDWGGLGRRFYATAELISGTFSWSSEFIRLSGNPAKGKGGVCFGDSGGPDLIGGTNVVIAVNSYAASIGCTGVSYSQRVDIPDVLSWIQSFLE